MYQIGIVGSRDWTNMTRVFSLVKAFDLSEVQLHTGCCPRGVDRFIATAPIEEVIHIPIVHEAKWDKYRPENPRHKNPAGVIRNEELVKACQMVFVFQKNKSPGSQNVIKLCKKHNRACFVYSED